MMEFRFPDPQPPRCTNRRSPVWRAVLCAAFSLCGILTQARAEETPVPAASPAKSAPGEPSKLSPAEIATAIEELGHDEFSLREAAFKRLAAAGVDAVKPLASAAESTDPEVAARAIRALDRIFRSKDDTANAAAEIEFEKLAESGSVAVAERARETLTMLVPVRDQRAAWSLERMGAEVCFTDELRPQQNRGVIIPGQPLLIRSRTILIGEDWQGGVEGLAQLRRIAQIDAVYVTPGAKLSDETYDRLEREFPARVQKRGAAMLGVSADTHDIGCVISRLTPGGPAQKAGLREHDLILLYDDEAVVDFEFVIRRTFDIPPGKPVSVTVARGEQILTLPVTLEKFSLRPTRPEKETE